MSGSPARTARLGAWALATFHSVAFVLVALLFLYSNGALARLLEGLSTLAGLALFLALWAATAYTTARALAGLAEVRAGTLLPRAVRWGGFTGLLFLGGLAVVALVSTALTRPAGALSFVLFVPVAAPFAFVVAYAVGAVIGLVLGTIDLLLFAVTARVLARV